MSAKDFFLKPNNIPQKQYEALRCYFVDGLSAQIVAKRFGYSYRGFTTLITKFNQEINSDKADNYFFVERKLGRKKSNKLAVSQDIIIHKETS